MPYVGNSPASNFASVTKDTFSGDGSTTAFTLSKAATTNGVAVFVENVRQEPTTAYAVSGTTLTFTAAPVSASGNNIYVLHHNAPASTATHPASQDLTAANATLTGDVTVGSGTAADRKILFDGNAQDYHIGLDDSADTLNIGKGSALGTTTAMTFDANGQILKPLQCMFEVRANTTQSINHGSTTKVTLWGTETTDIGGNFASNAFTAPVTGHYLSTGVLTFSLMAAGSHISLSYFHTPSGSGSDSLLKYAYTDSTEINITHPVVWTNILTLNAGDALQVAVNQGSGGAEDIGTANNSGGGTTANSNYWTMFLLG